MSLDLGRIRALCFDVDGTLSDTDDQFVQTLVGWMEPGRFLFRKRDPKGFARWVVMNTESPANYFFGLPDRLGIDGQIAHLGDLINQKRPHQGGSQFLLIEGVREMLARLSERFPLAVVSARGERSTRAFLEQYDLARFFGCVATAQTCRFTKPYPDPILWAAEKMGVPPQECLMIGDTTVDIRAGKAAGAQTVGVLCGFGQEEELRRAGADLILLNTPTLTSVLLPDPPQRDDEDPRLTDNS